MATHTPIINRAEHSALSQFQYASSELLEARTLVKRVDTKYLLNRSRLPVILNAFAQCAHLVKTQTIDKPNYQTNYWDTPNHDFLRAHLRGKRPRHKVRIREYMDRQIQYLEVKTATPSHRTHKTRVLLPYRTTLSSEQLHSHALITHHDDLKGLVLQPSITTIFQRFTLLGLASKERMTIDIQPRFKSKTRQEALTQLVIIELKQERAHPRSPMMKILRSGQAHRMSFSKYCTGSALLFPSYPMPAYRAKLRHIQRRLHV